MADNPKIVWSENLFGPFADLKQRLHARYRGRVPGVYVSLRRAVSCMLRSSCEFWRLVLDAVSRRPETTDEHGLEALDDCSLRFVSYGNRLLT